MLDLVWLIPALPLTGFLVLLLFGRKLGDPRSGYFATLMVAASFAVTVGVFIDLMSLTTEERSGHVQTLFSWIPSGSLQVDLAFLADPLSLTMCLFVTGIGSLIHLYAVGYMHGDARFSKFFLYLNLFAFSMLMLVLGSNMLVTFLGWEGVGTCSYFLIAFWHEKESAATAGKKAFITNRVGDWGFMMAMFIAFWAVGSLDYSVVNGGAAGMASSTSTAIALFCFVGACGKSAQLPLYLWLPDAMEGPTPVSALIHAATMVTAGVYLMVRINPLLGVADSYAPTIIAIVGAATALFAATIAVAQNDIKKVLAYSTISQLGYMFLAVGSGAYVAAIFHMVTHAFFKALLFLGAGSVIHSMHEAYHAGHAHHDDAQDMRHMGGLRKAMPFTWAFMWIATLAIAGIPPFSGFFSKDEILGTLFARAHDSPLASATWFGIPGSAILMTFYVLGLVTALLTAIYMTRMMLYTFHGANRSDPKATPHLHEAPWIMTGPLAVLAVLSLAGGWLNVPALISEYLPVGAPAVLHHWLDPVVGRATQVLGGSAPLSHATEQLLILVAIAVAVAGIVGAWIFLKPARLTSAVAAPAEKGFAWVLANKYFVDEILNRGLVQPVIRVSRAVLWRGIDVGLIDGLMVNGSATLARGIAWVGARAQSGLVGNYAWAIVLGVLVLVGMMTIR